MKKVGLFLLGGSLLFLTGCGKKYDLSCTMEAEEDSLKVKSEFKLKYNDEKTKIEDAYVKTVVDVPSSMTDEELEQSEEYLKKNCDELGDKVDCDVKRSGRKLTFTTSGPVSDLPAVSSMLTENITLDAARETFEAAGYSCK